MKKSLYSIISFVLIVIALTACQQSRSKSVKMHMDGQFDEFDMVKMTLNTDPPGATVWIKIEMNVIARIRVDGREAEHVNPPDVHHDYEEWTIVGTTPLDDFSLSTAMRKKKNSFNKSFEIQADLSRVSVRLEKAGYETMELSPVSMTKKGTMLDLELQPTERSDGSTTQ